MQNRHRTIATPSIRGSHRPGFSLLELLVVIAVITVLAGILYPVLAAARDRAQQTTCLSNLRQIACAQLLYLQDWDERFPHWCFPAPPRPEPYGNFAFWTEYFQPYLRSDAVLRCPSADWPWEIPHEEKLAEYVLSTWGRGGRGTRQSPYWNWPGPSHTLARIRRPAETIAVIDGFTTGGWTSVDLVRHHGGSNTAFLDGHARWMTQDAFWALDQEQGVWFMRHASADR
jgi:prepilin-type N-terminal cleavage/methylation domain-containing protein/prepilin-type processing-associated H-X9-DG protein